MRNNNNRRAVMWALYSLFYVLVLLVETTVFADTRHFGAKLSFLPVAVACVAIFTGHEAGSLFGLCAGFFCTCAGGSALSIVTFAVIGVFAGWLCDAVFARKLVPAALVCLGALIIHQFSAFLLQRIIAGADVPFYWPLCESVFSWPAMVPAYFLCKVIRKAGGE